jgi:dolichol-phosphate mannosyltransferase
MEVPEISVVVPVYGSPGSLVELSSRLIETLERLVDSFELLLVNDGSPDDTWEIITRLSETDSRIIGINLSRNFGQHLAIHAGLISTHGTWTVVMDCDLQDRPEEIEPLFLKAIEGFDQVVAIRHQRQDPFLKRLTSKFFFKLLSFLTGEDLDHRVGNFGIYKRPVIDALLAMGDNTRTFSVLVRWVGFRRTTVEVQHDARKSGKTSYSIIKLLSLALQTIIGSSNKPLRLTVAFGSSISFLSILLGVWIALRKLVYDVTVVGWTSMMVVTSFLFGIVIGCIGILGLYVGQIFSQVKNRPLVIIESVASKNSR